MSIIIAYFANVDNVLKCNDISLYCVRTDNNNKHNHKYL